MRPIITPAPKALPRNPAGGERAGAGAAPHGAATSRSQGAARAPRAGAGRSPKAASSRKMVAQAEMRREGLMALCRHMSHALRCSWTFPPRNSRVLGSLAEEVMNGYKIPNYV